MAFMHGTAASISVNEYDLTDMAKSVTVYFDPKPFKWIMEIEGYVHARQEVLDWFHELPRTKNVKYRYGLTTAMNGAAYENMTGELKAVSISSHVDEVTSFKIQIIMPR